MYKTTQLSLDEIRKLKTQQEMATQDQTVSEVLAALQREKERVQVLRVALQRLSAAYEPETIQAAFNALETTS